MPVLGAALIATVYCNYYVCCYHFLNAGLMNFKIVLCWFALCAASIAVDVIEVDSTNGHDNSSCYNKVERPCRTLDYALMNGLTFSTNVTVMIHEGVYTISLLNLSFCNFTDITIYGAGSKLTTVKCSFGTGLGFFNVTQLVLANLTLFGGGRITNSTSFDTWSNDKTVYRAALYLQDCSNVTIDGLVITNSNGTGLILRDVGGNINMINSVFQFNEPVKTENFGDGGVSIFLTDCESAHGKIISHILPSPLYNIQNCIFNANVAISSYSTKTFNPITNAQKQFGHGGGLNFMTRGTHHNITIAIKDSNFTKNRAIWGGGLSIRLYNQPSGHQVILSNVLFDSNYLPLDGHVNATRTGGGAVRIEILPKHNSEVLNTGITFSNCTFQNNSAIFGGGVSIELLREDPISTMYICFINCTWQHNIARLGSALDAYVHPYPFGKAANCTIDSCKFINNTNHYTELPVRRQGIGTLYSWSVPIFFNGKNTFTGNYGSALVGIDTWFTFQCGSVVVFVNNTAENGGAITLFENSYLMLYEDIELNFTHNKANGKGGAIQVITISQRDLIGSQYCFVSFHNLSVSPYEWKQKNIKVYFGHNKAKYGNSIFSTTLYACAWGEVNEIQLSDIFQVYYWNGAFMYENVSNVNDLSQEISSEATYVKNINSSYSIPPGKLYNFDFKEENERMEQVDAVYFVTTNGSSVAAVDETELYTLNDFTMLHGKPGSIFNLKMVTVNNLPLSISVKVKLDECPPGFYLSFPTDTNKTLCRCSVNVPNQDYLGIVECDNKNLVAYLRPGYYAGYVRLDGKKTLLTAGCPEGYCYSNSSYIELPPNSSIEALDDLICKPKHRTGTLCGKCLEGNYIYVNSFNYECGKCTNSWVEGAFMLIGLKYIPLIIFLYIVGLFGISLVNGPLNSVVLFSQLLPYMNIYAGGRVRILNRNSVTGVQFIYGMWSLDFFELSAPNFCVLPTKSTLEMLLFKNLTPVLFGFILSIIYILVSERNNIVAKADVSHSSVRKYMSYLFCKLCCKCCSCFSGCVQKYKKKINELNRKICGHKENEASTCFCSQGLITCVVLCYVKLTALGFNLWSNTTLYGSSKDDSEESLSVFWLDGTLKYPEDAPWTLLVAIVCLILVTLIPFAIFLYPIVAYLYNNNERNIPGYIFQFYDSLRLCYKDNYIACFFTAIYFYYRFGALAIYAFTTTMHYQYLWQCGFFLTMLLIHCMVQPYKIRIYNIIDGIIFFNMTLISLLSLYRLYAVDVGLSETNKAFTFQLILIYLPFVYIVLLWPCMRYYKFIKEKYKNKDGYIWKLIKFVDWNLFSKKVEQKNMELDDDDDNDDGTRRHVGFISDTIFSINPSNEMHEVDSGEINPLLSPRTPT